MPFPSKITFCVLVSPLEYKLSSVWERCVIVIAESPSPNSVIHTVGKHVCGINKNLRGQGAWLDLIPAPIYSLFPLFYFIYLSREKRKQIRMKREIHGCFRIYFVLKVDLGFN